MAKSYKVSVVAGNKILADMVQQVKDVTWQKVTESMPAIQGGTTIAAAVALPAGPTGQNRWFDASWGYWKYNNVVLKNPLGTDGIPQGNDGMLYWDGTAVTWEISKIQELPSKPITGIVAEGDTNATSGDAVFKGTIKPVDLKYKQSSNQIFDKTSFRDNTSIVSDGRLSYPDGAQTTFDILIPRDSEKKLIYNSVAISGLYESNNHRLRFLKEDGTIITPIPSQFLSSRIEAIPTEAYYVTVMFRNNGEPVQNVPKDTFMLNWGNVILSYEDFKASLIGIKNNEIISSSVITKTGQVISADSFQLKQGNIKVFISTTKDKWYVRVPFSNTHDLFHLWGLDALNRQPDFVGVLKLSINTADKEDVFLSNQFIKSGSDDICPIRFDTNYLLSGGHGVTVRTVTVTHGKSASDLLSIWSDGPRQWRLIEIVNINTLKFIPMPSPTDNGVWVNTAFASENLAHVDGAANTNSINVSVSTSGENNKCLKEGAVLKLILDGKEISEPGIYFGSELKVIDEHTVVDIRNLTAQVPFKTNAGSDLLIERITYIHDKYNNVYVDYIFEGRANAFIEQHGFMQFQRAITSVDSANQTMLYIPDSGNISNGTTNFNLALNPVNIFNPLGGNNSLKYTPANIPDNTKPIFRAIELQQTSTGVKKHGFAHGYSIDLGTTKNTSRKNIAELWEIRNNSAKSYPSGIRNFQMTANTVLQAKAIRSIYNPEINPEFTAVYHYKEGNKFMLFIDAHKTLAKQIVIVHPDLIGKRISVKQTGGQITLLTSDYIPDSNQLIVNCDTYGYLILELT